MENPEEILHSLEEFSKMRPKDIPKELDEYLCFVAKTGDPIYQWAVIKSLFREKLISVISEFYETCPSVDIPPCPNVDLFNFDVMKNFILEKLDTFSSAPFTVQRICELLTTPRKEYNRIDKYMRALEKNILVVSTTEPGGRRNTENGDGVMNGLESEHLPETSNSSNDINVEEMDETPLWSKVVQNDTITFQMSDNETISQTQITQQTVVQETVVSESKISTEIACSSTQETVITCRNSETTDQPYVSIEPVPSNTCRQENIEESDVSVTITAIPAGVQRRRSSVEPIVSPQSESETSNDKDETTTITKNEIDIEVEEEEEPENENEIKDNVDSSSNKVEVAQEEEVIVEASEGELEEATQSDSAVVASDLLITAVESSLSDEQDDKITTESTDDITLETVETVVENTNTEIIQCSEELSVDTTKCSENFSEIIQENICSSDDTEITSSSSSSPMKCTDESEGIPTEEEKSIEDNCINEAAASDLTDNKEEMEEESQIIDSNQISDDKIEESTTTSTSTSTSIPNISDDSNSSSSNSIPMEVEEEITEPTKIDDVVKAEATSDSSL